MRGAQGARIESYVNNALPHVAGDNAIGTGAANVVINNDDANPPVNMEVEGTSLHIDLKKGQVITTELLTPDMVLTIKKMASVNLEARKQPTPGIQVQGEPGKSGKQGRKGVRGLPGVGIPGRDGRDAVPQDTSSFVKLESIQGMLVLKDLAPFALKTDIIHTHAFVWNDITDHPDEAIYVLKTDTHRHAAGDIDSPIAELDSYQNAKMAILMLIGTGFTLPNIDRAIKQTQDEGLIDYDLILERALQILN